MTTDSSNRLSFPKRATAPVASHFGRCWMVPESQTTSAATLVVPERHEVLVTCGPSPPTHGRALHHCAFFDNAARPEIVTHLPSSIVAKLSWQQRAGVRRAAPCPGTTRHQSFIAGLSFPHQPTRALHCCTLFDKVARPKVRHDSITLKSLGR